MPRRLLVNSDYYLHFFETDVLRQEASGLKTLCWLRLVANFIEHLTKFLVFELYSKTATFYIIILEHFEVLHLYIVICISVSINVWPALTTVLALSAYTACTVCLQCLH